MRPETIPLIALIVFAMVDGCADTPPALVHVDRVESLCDHVTRKQRSTLRLCRDTVDGLNAQLRACRGITATRTNESACAAPCHGTPG